VGAAPDDGNDGEVHPAVRARLLAGFGVALLLLLVVVTWGGPGVARAASPIASDAPLRLRMFGDSVMLGARDDLVAAFPGIDASVDAFENRSLLGTTPVLVAHPELLGDVVVLDLGYNDMPDGAVFQQRIDAMMLALVKVPRVVWLTQSVFQPARAIMNDELRAAADRYPNLDVVDWDAQVAAHPEFVYPDGLHLTPPGRTAFAVAVQQRVDAYRASLARPHATVTSATEGADEGADESTNAVATTPGVSVAGATPARRAEVRAEAVAAPTAGPTGRTVAAVAIGGVALVVLAGAVLLRRAQTAPVGSGTSVTAGGSDRSRHTGRTPATHHWRGAGTGAPGPRRSP
jgi:hypothetical protein